MQREAARHGAASHPASPAPPRSRSIIKREVEERLGSHGEFGRVSFARLSFGRQPPVITGVKGVPLRDGEALAMGEDAWGHRSGVFFGAVFAPSNDKQVFSTCLYVVGMLL